MSDKPSNVRRNIVGDRDRHPRATVKVGDRDGRDSNHNREKKDDEQYNDDKENQSEEIINKSENGDNNNNMQSVSLLSLVLLFFCCVISGTILDCDENHECCSCS